LGFTAMVAMPHTLAVRPKSQESHVVPLYRFLTLILLGFFHSFFSAHTHTHTDI
jgi:hypothetical protein